MSDTDKMTLPEAGGSYTRDPEDGSLSRTDDDAISSEDPATPTPPAPPVRRSTSKGGH